MNTSIGTWMLAGALAASLCWNVKGALGGAEDPPAAASASSAECVASIDLERLSLSAEQRAALVSWSANACAPACAVDLEAEQKFEDLQRALRDPAIDAEALRALAADVSRARAESLDACVDSILEVRRVLSAQQLQELMQCCGTNCSSP